MPVFVQALIKIYPVINSLMETHVVISVISIAMKSPTEKIPATMNFKQYFKKKHICQVYHVFALMINLSQINFCNEPLIPQNVN